MRCLPPWPFLALLLSTAPAVSQEARGPLFGGAVCIDLSNPSEAGRRVVVDREPGRYLGHPTTVLLENGRTILVVYPRGHGKGPILMKRSGDGGRTWSDRLPTPENWQTSLETPTIHRVIDAAGTKRLILFSGLYPIRESVSEDDGATWTPLKPIGEFGGIVAMSSLVRLASGDYMALFHDDGRYLRDRGIGRGGGKEGAFTVFKTLSRDGGRSWTAPEAISSKPPLHLCEPGAIRSPDGRQLAVLLRENSRRRNSHLITSDDEGRTWSEPRELPRSLTGDRHVAKFAPDGRLLVSFRDTAAGSPTAGDWVAWVGTYDDVVKGRNGAYRVRLMDNRHGWDCGYAGVETLADGTFVLTTYGHWDADQPPYIVSVRLRLDELDALARGSS
ncbi:sialidase family protein, partial [Aquisphaera insulae]|uniref:sialidase family protein n=1 Tax=Aquisphaera insulae TaxID=2712864 RepID=UPI0013EAA08C